ncbi:MAG: hypothetical protein ACI9W6_001572 [Motiliproteus sp.]|jgi:hypothetical protein
MTDEEQPGGSESPGSDRDSVESIRIHPQPMLDHSSESDLIIVMRPVWPFIGVPAQPCKPSNRAKV